MRSNKNIEKMERTRSRTHGGDRKTRPIANHDGRRARGMWGSDKRKDTGGVSPMVLKDCAGAACSHPPGQVGGWLG